MPRPHSNGVATVEVASDQTMNMVENLLQNLFHYDLATRLQTFVALWYSFNRFAFYCT